MKLLSATFLAAMLAVVIPAGADEPEPDGEKTIPASAEIEFSRTAEEIAANVHVTIEPNDDGSIYQIGDWGEPRYEGDVIYLDARADGPLESFNTEPIRQSHEYRLFPRGEAEWNAVEFETLELIPEFLRPEQREEVVIRTLEGWNDWLSRHWPPNIDAPPPAVPVDFETHMVVGVFLGREVEGSGVEIHKIETNGEVTNVHYAEWIAGVTGDDGEVRYHRPGHLVALRQSDLPVLFNGRAPGGETWQRVEFQSVELVPEWMRPVAPEDVVIRTEEEWSAWVSKHFPPDVLAPMPGPPVDFADHTLIGTFLGETDQGLGIEITSVSSNSATIRVDVLETLPGVMPEDPEKVRPGHMVAIARTDLAVHFEHEVLAFPGPPPGDDPDMDAELSIAAQELGELPDDGLPAEGSYHVVFSIDGVAYARAVLDLGTGAVGIPARAGIDIEQTDTVVNANVEVAFTGAPYHTIAEWGPVERRGNHFILNSTANEIVFVREPDLPYFESHTFALLEVDDDGDGNGEPNEFRRVENDVRVEEKKNVVIQSRDEWWALIGFEPGPLVLPPPDPIDFEKETLIAVFRGTQPNGCYHVKITGVVKTPDGIRVDYQLRDPRPGEGCTEALVYPASLVAMAKNEGPFEFVEHPDPGTDADSPDPTDVSPGADGEAGAGGALESGERYTVEFRIDGRTYAETSFIYGDPDGDGGVGETEIPARASLEIEEIDAGLTAHVEVAFTGFPYHTVSDWGPVIQRDDLIVFDAEAIEINFVQEPELPYFESHRYHLPISDLPGDDRDRVITLEFRLNGEVYARVQHLLGGGTSEPEGELPPGFLVWLGEFVPDATAELDPDAALDGGGMASMNRDGDRWTDVQEFWLGLSPVKADDSPAIRPEFVMDDAGRHFAISFQRRKQAEVESGVEFIVQASADLESWIDDPGLVEHVSSRDVGAEMEEVTIRLDADAAAYRFLRLKLAAKAELEE